MESREAPHSSPFTFTLCMMAHNLKYQGKGHIITMEPCMLWEVFCNARQQQVFRCIHFKSLVMLYKFQWRSLSGAGLYLCSARYKHAFQTKHEKSHVSTGIFRNRA